MEKIASNTSLSPARASSRYRQSAQRIDTSPITGGAEIMEYFRELCREGGLFVESATPSDPRCAGSSAYRLSPDFGDGWMDITQIGRGVVIGRAEYAFKTPWSRTYAESPESVGICIMLSGQMKLRHADGDGRMVSGGTLCLWRRGAAGGEFTYDLRSGDYMQGVSIDLPLALAEDLFDGMEGGRGGVLSELLEGCGRPKYARLDRRPSATAARALLRAPAASMIDRLRMESAALTLLADLLGGDLFAALGDGSASGLPRRHRCAVDDAVEILRAEFTELHTINSLAKRVGLNECYLKAAFRTQTGKTIAGYLRDLRMRHALSMIEEGRHTIQDIAIFVGYANPSHFAAAFRRVHGLSPSRIR